MELEVIFLKKNPSEELIFDKVIGRLASWGEAIAFKVYDDARDGVFIALVILKWSEPSKASHQSYAFNADISLNSESLQTTRCHLTPMKCMLVCWHHLLHANWKRWQTPVGRRNAPALNHPPSLFTFRYRSCRGLWRPLETVRTWWESL